VYGRRVRGSYVSSCTRVPLGVYVYNREYHARPCMHIEWDELKVISCTTRIYTSLSYNNCVLCYVCSVEM
jgi:hypothetical protein